MTFLSPSAFWLLIAIGIPIALHLLSLFRSNTVEFSSVRYIKQLKSSSIRNIKIRKLLLLLSRILCITSIVFMIARPVTKGFMPGWLAAEQDASLVLLIDNSASMSAQSDNKSFLDRSKNEMMALMTLFNDKTKVIIVQTCPPKIVFRGKSNDPELRSIINTIDISSSYDNIWETINWVLTEEKINDPIRECVIFSDLMHSPDSAFISGIDELSQWKFYFIQPETVSNNLGIINVSRINRIKTMNQLIKLDAYVKNLGNLNKKNISLELLFNDNRVGQVISEFMTEEKKGFLFQAYPEETGILQSKIMLPKDDYDLDNYWYDAMPIMEQIQCEIIGSDSNDISVVKMIFEAIDPERKFLTIRSSIQSNLKRLYLDDVDVVIIHDLEGLSEEAVKDIIDFLKNGGGVIWFQGNPDMNNLDKDLITKLGFPQFIQLINSGQGFFTTHLADNQSDLLDDLRVRNIDKELPEIYKYVKVKTEPYHNIHWRLNNGDPFLLEFSKGTGKVFYFATLLDLRWNDFPIRAVVVPLMYRLIILTGTDLINTSPVLIDEPKWISVDESKLMHKWEVFSPSGEIEMIVPKYDREGILITNTDELGFYQVFNNGVRFTSFPTRLHYKENIQNHIDQEDIEFCIPNDQTRWLTIQDDFVTVFSETRQGKSLWKLFLFFAFLFILIETILGESKPNIMKLDKD